MDKILIFNGNNQQMEVDVVRYFSDGGNNYFVFSLNELDSQGHMNIYVTKVINQNGSNVGTNIVDDVEWSNLKSNLQRIIKENRANGNAVVSDISIDSLQGLKILDRRALKLLATSVDMLNLGYVGRNSVSNDVNDDAVFAPKNVEHNVFSDEEVVYNEQSVAPQYNDQPVAPQYNAYPSVQNNVNGVNYEMLYLQEKANNERLIQERDSLVNELNAYKIKISDIKNILSK